MPCLFPVHENVIFGSACYCYCPFNSSLQTIQVDPLATDGQV